MIVIRAIPVAQHPQESLEFQMSLANNASDKNNYCVISKDDVAPESAKIIINLPDNCLVLGNSWDKYILYALENGLPKGAPEREETWMKWEDYVKKHFGLLDRRHHGIYPELDVTIP